MPVMMTTCKCCGEIYEAPGADGPLVRFRHNKYPDRTWELAFHPSAFNSNLPTETKVYTFQVELCQACFDSDLKKIDGGLNGSQ